MLSEKWEMTPFIVPFLIHVFKLTHLHITILINVTIKFTKYFF